MMSMVCIDSKYNSLYQLISNEVFSDGTQTLDHGMVRRVVYNCATAAGQGYWLIKLSVLYKLCHTNNSKQSRQSIF